MSSEYTLDSSNWNVDNIIPKYFINCSVCKKRVERQTLLQRECEDHEFWEMRRPKTVEELLETKVCHICAGEFKPLHLKTNFCSRCQGVVKSFKHL